MSRASSDVETLFGDWKRTQPLSVSGEESIGDSRRDGQRAGLANTAWLLGAFNDRHRDLWHLCQMQHRIGIKISLLDPTKLKSDFAIERRGDAGTSGAGVQVHGAGAARCDPQPNLVPVIASVAARQTG